MRVLVVDAANVVGSRPDGWWRDRAAAAARLHGRLVTADARGRLGAERVLLVLEGRARAGVPVGAEGPVETVHAPGDGDDEVVRQVAGVVGDGPRVEVVTSDRGLAERVEPLGAAVVRPGRLLAALDPSGPSGTDRSAG